MSISSLPYYGKKSILPGGSGTWINSLLPTARDVLYLEPFFGMGNVLIGRPKSHVEVVNDINDRLVNWWIVVRDKPDELIHLSTNTPLARKSYYWAHENLDNTYIGNAHRALALTIVLEQGLVHGDSDTRKAWGCAYNPKIGSLGLRAHERIELLSQRIQDVQIECTDAIKVISKATYIEDAIIYCDPPLPHLRHGFI